MSTVSTLTVDTRQRSSLPPIKPERRILVARVAGIRRIGIAALGLQLVGFLVWSVLLASRYSLNQDFATYHQALYLIGRGDFNPFITGRGITVWHDHGQFILLPLALLFDLWPHTVTILWMADLSVFGAELIAFLWMCDVVELHSSALPRWARSTLPLFGVALLVLNPLTWWGVAFDVHTESFAVFFLTFAAYDFFHDRRRAWIWVVLTALCGDIGSTYLVALALTLLLVDWRRWPRMVVLAAIGFGNLFLLSSLHFNQGSILNTYVELIPARLQGKPLGMPTFLKLVVTQPAKVLSIVWHRRLAFFANLSPPGVIGLATRWTLPIPAIILLENGLQGSTGTGFLSLNFAFQSFGVYVFVAIGAVMICTSLVTAHPRWMRMTAGAVIIVLLVNVTGWAAVWADKTPGSWVRVSAASAAVLSGVNAQIGPDDEVIVSQGVVGAFAGRRSVYPIVNADPGVFPINERRVWIIILPNAGIETARVNNSEAAIGLAAALPGAHLVASANGVWAIRWDPPQGTNEVHLYAGPNAPVPGWTVAGAAGKAVTDGPLRYWRTWSTGATGYVVSGDYWPETNGKYLASANLSSTGPANFEVWDSTTNVLLARQTVVATTGPTTVSAAFTLTHALGPQPFGGIYPWNAAIGSRDAQLAGDSLEIRIWNPARSLVVVYSLQVSPKP